MLCSVEGGYGSPLVFQVSATKTDNHLSSEDGYITVRMSSGHSSVVSAAFLFCIQLVKFWTAHLVASLVLLGMHGFASSVSSVLVTFPNLPVVSLIFLTFEPCCSRLLFEVMIEALASEPLVGVEL